MPPNGPIEMVNLVEGYAVHADGRTLPITNMFDATGTSTTDPDKAVSFVCGKEAEWYSDRIDSYQPLLKN